MTEKIEPERRGPDRVRVATVLLVDDSTTIRRILRRDLEAVGYRVVEADNGEAGLALLAEELPDLVLLDVDMPVLDGLATMERMQADPRLAPIPVLFLTARTGGGEVARGLDLGAHDYLKKPCDQQELLARVATALRRQAREEAVATKARDLAALSTTDPLTRLGNRRRLEEELAGLDGSRLVGVLLADLDHFKRINDTEGHVVGDAVLAVVAARLSSAAGDSATVVRWGGEEFVVLVPDTGPEDLTRVGERLCRAVGATPLAVGTPAPLSVTVSLGGSSGPVRDFDHVLARADAALYDAKRAGRDRVSVHGEEA